MAIVDDPAHIEAAVGRCASEALLSFGDGRVFVEEYLTKVRHIEVQVVGDGIDAVVMGDRDCSLQRRRQKVIEVAPAQLNDDVRRRLHEAALTLARAVSYRSLGTFEFLVTSDDRVVFIEANARIQVEHTITEELTGLDLVEIQLAIADGARLGDLGLMTPFATPDTMSVQVRLNAEVLSGDGTVSPAVGTVREFRPPYGPGIRVESAIAAGVVVGPQFDSLMAKIIVTSSARNIHRRLSQALAETSIRGVDSTLDLMAAMVEAVGADLGHCDTSFVEDHLPALVERAATLRHARPPESGPDSRSAMANSDTRVDTLGGEIAAVSPLVGMVVSVDVAVGDLVAAGSQIAVIEAMKMEHLVVAESSGIVARVLLAPGDTVIDGAVLLTLTPAEVDAHDTAAEVAVDPAHVRPDLAETIERHDVGLDHRRPEAVARRRKVGRRTARENIADLLDDGSFVEYGALVLAAQRRRRSVQELIEKTPGDGLVGGIGTIGAGQFDDARVAVMTYDYTVLAGTQGGQNHRKKDRLFEIAERWGLPVVVFAEGGGGRPGDTDGVAVAGLDCLAFWYFAKLSGQVPLVGINTGYCFAGNAALLGMCDVIISTRDANLGMGGPAMIEGGGLGVFHPSEVGPVADQWPNGVIDILVDDDAEAVAVAQQYLSYFQGPVADWSAADQRLLRHVIPENRLRMYDVRRVIELLADTNSVLELRGGFGPGMVTALARIEGRPVGMVANDPAHLAGAIDSDGADKASRFMQLCDAFGIPIVNLCDTPGIMVGPDAERSGTVRHAARLFITGASLEVPFCTVVLRKGYGLGAQAMAGGSFKAPMFTIAWPTGEFGGMGLEGAVKLGYRNELAAIDDPAERARTYDDMVERMYHVGKALNFASVFEIDDVIDPADTRRWITGAFNAAGPSAVGRPMWNRRPMVDPY